MKNKGNNGITLIALVVTIVILIILATISINLVFSENGIISKAESAEKFQTNAVASDRDAMDTYKQYIANAVAGSGVTYAYTCPYCGTGHDTFDGGAVISMVTWIAYDGCSCGLETHKSVTTPIDQAGICPNCGNSIEYENENWHYETACCNVVVCQGYDTPDDSAWTN